LQVVTPTLPAAHIIGDHSNDGIWVNRLGQVTLEPGSNRLLLVNFSGRQSRQLLELV